MPDAELATDDPVVDEHLDPEDEIAFEDADDQDDDGTANDDSDYDSEAEVRAMSRAMCLIPTTRARATPSEGGWRPARDLRRGT